ncbi:Menaquinone-specific isochorismate synthase [Grimontia indica]|uniref:Isochorismate synthase MenF n=1 Tax=Grimontia indica TaxID=1056512 RepID=R1GZN1_9GAMM|nr:isochorismate synthase [Grimontia indica]EOD81569.1 Menaquinone-specific isochorismate synthase [Grimontia indica]
MTDLSQAIARLVESLSTVSPLPKQITLPFQWPERTDPIDWLHTQPLFPKFYWQTRDGTEQVLALGQVKTFSDPASAERQLVKGQRIWGGRSFDGRTERNQRCLQSFFFLPQIEMACREGQWSITLNLCDDLLKVRAALSKLITQSQRLSHPDCDVLATQHQPEFGQWSTMIGDALSAIETTELQKVVLARKTTLELDRTLPAASLLKASVEINKSNFHFLLALDEKHCFVGSTPERLFWRDDSELYTEALAGTIGRGKDAEEDLLLATWLLNDSKNIYENRLVVEDITQRLNPHSEQLDVEVTPHLVRLRNVQHLKRDIEANLVADVPSSTLLDLLQPTAAVAGLPREKAVDFIVENEPFVRGWYSGSVGYLSPEQSEFCVAIRSALIVDNKVHLFAGAGIVPGSVAESEWKELDRKMATLRNLLGPSPDKHMEKKAG